MLQLFKGKFLSILFPLQATYRYFGQRLRTGSFIYTTLNYTHIAIGRKLVDERGCYSNYTLGKQS